MSIYKGIKILLVDDEPDILEFLSYNLKKSGYSVFTASDGRSGIDMAMAQHPDLIVLDIMMPNMDGIQVCQALRKMSVFKDTVIVFLTARGEDFTQITALDQGGDDFIQKPVKINVFISRINALLRRKLNIASHAKSHLIEMGDIVIDNEKYIVIKSDQKIELARKEFDLFSLLATKPGKVFNRVEILNTVWGREVIVGSRTIDVHIRKLREKLGDDIIKTIKGVGYKINL